MRNKNRYDNSSSTKDFSNSEGYHNYPAQADSEYRSDFRGEGRSEDMNTHSPFRGSQNQSFSSAYSQRPGARQGTYASDTTASYGSGNSESNRFDSSRDSSGGNLDWQSPARRTGPHTGKGPKGYKRSDERIREDACETLLAHSEIDASEVEIEVKEGLVTFSGTVESRQIKRMIEDLVEGLSGVTDIKNDLRILASKEAHGKAKSPLTEVMTDSDAQSRTSSAKANLASRPPSTASATTSKAVQ